MVNEIRETPTTAVAADTTDEEGTEDDLKARLESILGLDNGDAATTEEGEDDVTTENPGYDVPFLVTAVTSTESEGDTTTEGSVDTTTEHAIDETSPASDDTTTESPEEEEVTESGYRAPRVDKAEEQDVVIIENNALIEEVERSNGDVDAAAPHAEELRSNGGVKRESAAKAKAKAEAVAGAVAAGLQYGRPCAASYTLTKFDLENVGIDVENCSHIVHRASDGVCRLSIQFHELSSTDKDGEHTRGT